LRGKILGGGDDYELLFTVADHDAARAMELAAAAGVPVAVIGTLVSGSGVAVRADDGSAIAVAKKGFQHF
jgi:thiamine-monophosphate kinase